MRNLQVLFYVIVRFRISHWMAEYVTVQWNRIIVFSDAVSEVPEYGYVVVSL